jgi:peptidyl-Lys metalloendopeptidase
MLKQVVLAFALFCGVASHLLTQVSFGTRNNGSFPELEILLTNPLDKDLYILAWNTPFVSLNTLSSLVVTRDGKQIPYVGPIAKYGQPKWNDYLLIPRKTSLLKAIKLESYFDISMVGEYALQLQLTIQDYSFDSNQVPRKREHWQGLSLDASNVLEFVLYESLPQSSHVSQVAVNYDGCTAAQTKTIQTAFSSAIPMVSKALTALGTSGGGPNFSVWFGTGNLNTVTKVVSAVSSAFAQSRLNYKCNDPQCSDSTYAFVYPTDKNYVVYLCGAFWPSKACGAYDSQCGTLVHETSHFNTVGSTQDYAYGSTSCKSLAKSNPTRAIANADSYEYFCESSL